MVTINDIAKELGIAKSTVSNALSDLRYVSPQLKAKILAKCKELNYQPNFFASTLSSTNKTNIIGLFLDGEKGVYYTYFDDLIRSCVLQARTYGVNVLVYYRINPDEMVKLLGQGRSPIDGAILVNPQVTDERIEQLQEKSIPCVIIGQTKENIAQFNYVDYDNKKIISDIFSKLKENGHENIMFINSNRQLTITQERDEELKVFYLENEYNINKVKTLYATISNEDEGYNFCEQMLESINKYTAVICANDLLAKGFYKCLKKHAMIVGNDVSIIALGGDKYVHNELMPPLSHAYQDYNALGERAIEVLMKHIEGKKQQSMELLQSKITYTNSIGKAKE